MHEPPLTPPGTAIDAPLWRRVFGAPPAGVYVIIDPQVGQSRGQLRSLPLLAALGVSRFTFPAGWRGVDLVPYEYVLINETVGFADLAGRLPVCQIISQEIEDKSPSGATRKLLQAYAAAPQPSLLVYVLDSERFQLRDSAAPKSFMEEWDIRDCYAYDHVFARHLALAGGPTPTISADRTRNLALHQITGRPGAAIDKLRALFNYSDLAPDSPAWDLLEQLAVTPEVRRDDRAVHQLLRPWVETDISRIATTLLEALQSFDYDVVRIRQRRDALRGSR